MQSTTPVHVLIVAYKTSASPPLLRAVSERAARGPCHFSLVVPNFVAGLGPGQHQVEWKQTEGEHLLALALPLLEEAAGGPVDGVVSSDPNPYDVVENAVKAGDYDEIIVSTLPHTVSHWLRLDLPTALLHLGLPVTTVTAPHTSRFRHANTEESPG